MTSTAAHSIIYKITPESIGLEGTKRSTALHDGRLYLTLLNFDAERGKDLRKILSWNPANGQWTTLLNEILTDKYPERRVLHPTSTEGVLLTSTDIFLIPDIAGGSRIEFEFFSPCGKQRWQLKSDGIGVETVETISPLPKFLTWATWQDAVYALVESTTGERSLVRSSEQGWEPLPAPAAGLLSSLQLLDGQLLVTTDDARRGFTLWKLTAPAETEPGKIWQPILIQGALRFLCNASVQAATVWNDQLYLLAGVTDPVKIARLDEYYCAGGFELLLVPPDGTWEILLGTLRPSAQGLKVPLAGPASVFEGLLSPQARVLVACDGRLLLCAESELGYHAWESFDGLEWQRVWPDAFSTYESVKFAGQYPTAAGPVLIMETCDYEQRRHLELWLATAHAVEDTDTSSETRPAKRKKTAPAASTTSPDAFFTSADA